MIISSPYQEIMYYNSTINDLRQMSKKCQYFSIPRLVTKSLNQHHAYEVELERVRPKAGPARQEVQGRVRVQSQPLCQEQL